MKKRVKLELAAQCPTVRDRMWGAMRVLGEFTQREVATVSETSITAVKEYMRGLLGAGFVEGITELKVGVQRRYRMSRDVGADAPRVRNDGTLLPPTGRTRMWQAMAVLGSFSPAELARAASLPEAAVAEAEARTYCRWLERAGYLLAGPGPRYLSIPSRRHGPKAPHIQTVRRLVDPNTGEVFGEIITTEGGE